ncbi:hypothetical protein A2U01_0057648, partial [Trifolium medium]|nr:hypothetical protein [Trifolium medium]
MKAVLSLSLWYIGIWLYHEYASMNDNSLYPDELSTSLSMFGRGYESLGHALL